ncbi:MAG: H+-translocating transhydrogenase subunit beta [Clostridia bacterium]|nr:H+-translocating transhydrogenase subunit beta [Clostridia bacterium]MDN5376373.1 H+-translocating transhydrogenase subunit beta [Thermacetogenium sp.]
MGFYEVVTIVLAVVILYGIKLMSSPKTAVLGNRLGALSMFVSVLMVLFYNGIADVPVLWIAVLLGAIIGYLMAMKVAMIQMPQMVGLFNGLGGGASALVALVVIFETYPEMGLFSRFTSQLALVVGWVTLSGSLIAAGKLDRRIPQQPLVIKGHNVVNALCLLILGVLVAAGSFGSAAAAVVVSVLVTLLSLGFGVLFAIRVGGADMPITISLLNSYSGLAGAICGLTIGDPLLVSVGAIVGAAGIILTGIMCRAMNRSLLEVLNGSVAAVNLAGDSLLSPAAGENGGTAESEKSLDAPSLLKEAQKVIIVPGYGMAVSQAQWQVKKLLDVLESQGKEVKFAIHPVAGRMPGHMNVLLAEVDVPYDRLYEMEAINPEFKDTDVVVVIGACDVVNPAAITAEGTPIYGMPILRVDEAKYVVVCNMDTKPGYSGVPNPLYDRPNVVLLQGDAAETVEKLTREIQ